MTLEGLSLKGRWGSRLRGQLGVSAEAPGKVKESELKEKRRKTH